MGAEARRIWESALALSENERAELAAKLLDSRDEGSDPDAEEAWAAEITKRAEQIRAGEVVGIDADIVHEEVRRIIERR
jgi:putative addiction module component (TIGR02574 family)